MKLERDRQEHRERMFHLRERASDLRAELTSASQALLSLGTEAAAQNANGRHREAVAAAAETKRQMLREEFAEARTKDGSCYMEQERGSENPKGVGPGSSPTQPSATRSVSFAGPKAGPKPRSPAKQNFLADLPLRQAAQGLDSAIAATMAAAGPRPSSTSEVEMDTQRLHHDMSEMESELAAFREGSSQSAAVQSGLRALEEAESVAAAYYEEQRVVNAVLPEARAEGKRLLEEQQQFFEIEASRRATITRLESELQQARVWSSELHLRLQSEQESQTAELNASERMLRSALTPSASPSKAASSPLATRGVALPAMSYQGPQQLPAPPTGLMRFVYCS
eukprot:TRINITY_DN32288_c0_g1_i1.p1 TRINITY_DN32288_c0_g1~~TRINITY_DN32288_c0_g1_i1.p1  ORF type:complete len:339 (+),score=81.86 TRINITY_DN32288_c0_g1_i1:176-1192(+)